MVAVGWDVASGGEREGAAARRPTRPVGRVASARPVQAPLAAALDEAPAARPGGRGDTPRAVDAHGPAGLREVGHALAREVGPAVLHPVVIPAGDAVAHLAVTAAIEYGD